MLLVDSPEFFQVSFHINKVDDVIQHAAKYINNIISAELRNSSPLASYFAKLEAIVRSKNCNLGGSAKRERLLAQSSQSNKSQKLNRSSKSTKQSVTSNSQKSSSKNKSSRPKTGAKKSKTQDNPYHLKAFDFSFGDQPDCKFNGYLISGVAYRINQLNGFHLKFENDFLIQEYIVALDDSFDKNLENVVKEVLAENTELKDSIEKNKGNSIIEESIDKLHKAISALAKGSIACQAPNGDAFTCILNIGKHSFTIAKVVEKSRKEDFFQISLIDPPSTNKGNTLGTAHPEIFISKYNGYDQNARVIEQVKTFFEKVQKFKIGL